MNRVERAWRATVVVAGFGYTGQALSLVAIPLYLSTIGAENYGLMVTVMALMGYLSFADAGLSWGAMILIAEALGRNDRAGIARIVRHSAVLAAVSGAAMLAAITGLLLAAAAGWRLPMFAAHPGVDRLLAIAGLQLGLNLQFAIVYNLFQGLQENHWTGLYQGLARLLGLAGGMLAAWQYRSVEAVMWVQLAMTVASGIAATIHAISRHRWAFVAGSWTDASQYRALLHTGGGNFLLQVGRTLVATAPTLGISAMAGPALVPFYTVPTTLLGMVFVPLANWNANLQSAYGEAWAAGDREWVRRTFRVTLERALTLGGLGVAGFVMLGDPFIRLWTREHLSVGYPMALSVSAMAVTGMLLTAGQYLLTGLNHQRRAAVAEVLNGVLALTLVPLAVGWFGPGGVGAGAVLAAAVTSLWMLYREIRAHLDMTDIFPSVVLVKTGAIMAVAMTAAAGAQVGLGPDNMRTLPGIAGVGLAIAAIYVVAGIGLKLIPTEALAGIGRRALGKT